MRYTKKPVAIEALRWTDNSEEQRQMLAWIADGGGVVDFQIQAKDLATVLYVLTQHGFARVDSGNWIIKGIGGEFYPCTNDVFEQTYDR